MSEAPAVAFARCAEHTWSSVNAALLPPMSGWNDGEVRRFWCHECHEHIVYVRVVAVALDRPLAYSS
jgi:hypothetical protein